MTDKQRLYCRLDEASGVLSTSQGALLAAMEDRSLTLLVGLSAKSLLGFLVKDGKRTCLGRFDYDGVVEPRFDDAKAILNGRAGLVRFCNILESENIRNWREIAGDEMPFPNNLFQRYHHIERPNMVISAACNTSYSSHGTNTLAALHTMLENPAGITSPQDVMANVEKVVNAYGHRIKPQDLRCSLAEAKALLEKAIALSAKPIKGIKYSNDLHEVLGHMLLAAERDSAKEIWQVLEREAATSEGERTFDRYNILVDVSGSEVLWRDRAKGKEHYFSFASLGPTLTKIRKLQTKN